MIKDFKVFESNEAKYNAYNVWVVFRYGDYDINDIFLTKEEAEKSCKFKNNEYKEHFREEGRNKVETLDNDIDYIKDYTRDAFR